MLAGFEFNGRHRRNLSKAGLSKAFAGAFLLALASSAIASAQSIPTPASHFGHEIGADRELAHWDGIVDYMRLVGERSDRVNVRQTGESTDGRPFLLVEISAPETLRDVDRFKALQQRLYFQDHNPGEDPNSLHSTAQREELFRTHKAVVLITCSIHASEVGAAQMSLKLVHELATSDDPRVLKILDNVILLLVPSLNPDGQAMVVEWYDEYVGTSFEGGSMPWLYQRYVGHDNNRDMYMYTQEETRLIGEILWKEWFPSIWLDEHQMGSSGARIFVMPATDPINLNVHPLVYRLNGIYGQAQGAALEEAGKVGIVYDRTYTNFWPGAMAWTGWWHNQVGMLTELASVRIATPTIQEMARLGEPPAGAGSGGRGGYEAGAVQPPPRSIRWAVLWRSHQ
ncbi:M14 family zinc carboxypeptidase, partial [Gemmatimonadota bacterium]